jgi:hypothetical protein
LKTATLERQRIETPKQSLEESIHEADYRSREHALAELQAAIARILSPRDGFYFYAGSPNRHFLPIPASPGRTLTRAGWPDDKSIDAKEVDAVNAELEAITKRERALNEAAQKSRNMVPPLLEWAVELGKTEDRLLLSALIEEDRGDVETYIREHRRFLRTVEAWTNKLVF